jgi:uncharacterized protein YyaL (SSP411 family)
MGRRFAPRGAAAAVRGAAAAVIVATTALAAAGESDAQTHALANRLGAEPSDYLRSAGSSPVAWQPWGAPAFRLARELDRPILLSIGADWCHWCHVMDRDTYADASIAAFINAHFVPIKVDRDDRPDVDARYQESARHALDTAGWPLTLFLTPDGELVSGGATFFPDERDGVPGLRALMPRVVALLRERPDEARAAAVTARRLAQAPAQAVRAAPIAPKLAAEVVTTALGEFDVIHAGFGHQGKQVPGAILTLFARRLAETGDPRLRDVLTRTLDAMAIVAIRDHLGGGFFRDTTDRAWRRPRFERLDLIQAQAIGAYLLGYQATGAPRYRAIAEEVLAYTDRVLVRREGGFNAGQRVEGPDGDARHFLWNEAEVRAALPAAEADLMVRHFGLAGVAERRALAVDVSAAELATAAGVPLDSMERRLRVAKDRLRETRAKRGEPAIDATVYADRSALLASAYLEAYKVLGGDERLRVALDTLNFLWTRLRQPDGSMAHAFRDGRVIADGRLDDQFAVASASLDAFEVTGVARHLEAARALVAHAVARFRAADGGFFDTPLGRSEPGVPEAPRKRFMDDDRPGGNALAALVLERLHALTNEDAYRTLARDTLAALPVPAPQLGWRFATYAYAADLHVNGALHVVIAGKTPDPRTRGLWRGALRAFRPGKIVAAYDPDLIDAAAVPAPVAAMLRQTAGADPRAYVCSGTVCSLPQNDAERLRELVERLGRKP